MTVIDVNTGKFTGQGGNLEQTVTRNNLEAAEEIVRQLRLRDVGGIIVIDFIDMVLESNRDLVLRRLIECLARDRTKHQVAEVTSLGLVQMTRKRVGSGLLAAFSVPCEHCNGRGVLISTDLTEIPHAHGRNGQHGSTPKPGPSRSRSARTKAIAQVARTLSRRQRRRMPRSSRARRTEPAAAAVPARSGSAKSANGGSSGRGSSARSRRSGQSPIERLIQRPAELQCRIQGPTVRPRMRRPRSRPRPALATVPSRRTARRKRAVSGSLRVRRPATEEVRTSHRPAGAVGRHRAGGGAPQADQALGQGGGPARPCPGQRRTARPGGRTGPGQPRPAQREPGCKHGASCQRRTRGQRGRAGG